MKVELHQLDEPVEKAGPVRASADARVPSADPNAKGKGTKCGRKVTPRHRHAESLETVHGISDLVAAGEGSKPTIYRKIKEGTFDPPDYYDGIHPKWFASTIRRRRERLMAEYRRALEMQQRGAETRT